MRLMERIRRRFRIFFMFFMIIFVISAFGGLGVGFLFSPARNPTAQLPTGYRSFVPGVTIIAEIGDKKILPASFEARYARIESLLQMTRRTPETDPFNDLETRNMTLEQMFREEALSNYARENGIGVSESEVNKRIDELISQISGPVEKGEKQKSIVSEAFKQIRSYGERQKLLRDYLERNNMTRAELVEQVRREELVTKASDAINKAEEEKGDKIAKEKLEKIKAELKAGKDFAEVAKKYSEDESTRDKGGLIDFMMPRTFLDPAVADVAFKLKKGEYSEPIKQSFGYELVQVVDKIEAKGKDFEKRKPELIESLKKKHSGTTDFQPSEEEIAKEYERVKIRHIIVRNTYQAEAEKRIAWMIEGMKRVIYDPQILAYRALEKKPLFFPQTKDISLTKIASQVKGMEKFDPEKLERLVKRYEEDYWQKMVAGYGKPPEEFLDKLKEAGVPVEELTKIEEKAAEKSTPKKDSQERSKVNEGKAEKEVEIPLVPAYPLAVGLFLEASKTSYAIANLNYFAAKAYDDWLDNRKARELFPLNVDSTRAEIERLLKEAIDKYEYEPHFYALLGKNYAEWVKPEEARKALELAVKYGGKDEAVLRTVQSAYIEIGDRDKADEISKKLYEVEKEKSKGGGTNIPIRFPQG